MIAVSAGEGLDSRILRAQPMETSQILHPFESDGRWGYYDGAGNVVIEARYTIAHDFFEDRAAVQTDDATGYIDLNGSLCVRLPSGAAPVGRFCEGRAWFRHNGHFGCVDLSGRVVIHPSYESFNNFSGGFAAVAKVDTTVRAANAEGKTLRWGFVDRSGRLVIPLSYVYVSSFVSGLARVRERDKDHDAYISENGDVAFRLNGVASPVFDALFVDGMLAVELESKTSGTLNGAFVDTRGRLLQWQRFETVWPFSEGLAAVKDIGKVGYIDTLGRIVISARYDDGGSFSEGLCRVLLDGEWRFVDRAGTVACERHTGEGLWNDAEDFHGGLARIHVGGEFQTTDDGPQWWEGGEWVYIDRRGKKISTCRVDAWRYREPSFGRELPASADSN